MRAARREARARRAGSRPARARSCGSRGRSRAAAPCAGRRRSPASPTASSASRTGAAIADRRGRHQVAAERGAVADQARREQRQQLREQRHRGGRRVVAAARSISVSVRPAPSTMASAVDARTRAARAAPPARPAAGADRRFWVTSTITSVPPAISVAAGAVGQAAEQVVEAGRADEPLGAGPAARHVSAAAPASRARESRRIVGRRRRQPAGDVGDRPIAGAAAQVAADRLRVEAVRARAGSTRRTG